MPESPVKVVQLITLLEFGGAQGNTIHTVQNLNPALYEAHLWSGTGAYWDKKLGVIQNLKGRVRFFRFLVRPLNPLFDVLAIIQLRMALAFLNPQILHTHSSKAGILGRIAGRLAGVPNIVHTFHGFGFNDHQNIFIRWLYIALERLTALMTNKLIFVSEANREEAAKLKIGKPAQYELIRSGVPLGKLRSLSQDSARKDIQSELNISMDTQLVITVGAFKPQKNLFEFLAVARHIHDRRPDTTFVILGDGVQRQDLERKVKELGLIDCVKMPGWREDASRCMAASDLFVMTSLWEGLPRALVEAIALGVAPVCYDADGVRDILSSEPEIMVPRGQTVRLADKAVSLLNSNEERKELAQRLQERIGQDFDIDYMVRQQESLYAELLK